MKFKKVTKAITLIAVMFVVLLVQSFTISANGAAQISNFATGNVTDQMGDTNLDGIVSISDVTAIQRHLAELEVFNDEQLALADTNGDGDVDIADATHLQMYLAEYDVVLGKQTT